MEKWRQNSEKHKRRYSSDNPIAKQIVTKASLQIVNHSFQFVSFEETFRIREDGPVSNKRKHEHQTKEKQKKQFREESLMLIDFPILGENEGKTTVSSAAEKLKTTKHEDEKKHFSEKTDCSQPKKIMSTDLTIFSENQETTGVSFAAKKLKTMKKHEEERRKYFSEGINPYQPKKNHGTINNGIKLNYNNVRKLRKKNKREETANVSHIEEEKNKQFSQESFMSPDISIFSENGATADVSFIEKKLKTMKKREKVKRKYFSEETDLPQSKKSNGIIDDSINCNKVRKRKKRKKKEETVDISHIEEEKKKEFGEGSCMSTDLSIFSGNEDAADVTKKFKKAKKHEEERNHFSEKTDPSQLKKNNETIDNYKKLNRNRVKKLKKRKQKEETVDTSHIQEESFMSPDFSIFSENGATADVSFIEKKLKTMKKREKVKRKYFSEETDLPQSKKSNGTIDDSINCNKVRKRKKRKKKEETVDISHIEEEKKKEFGEGSCMSTDLSIFSGNEDAADVTKKFKKAKKHEEERNHFSEKTDPSQLKKNNETIDNYKKLNRNRVKKLKKRKQKAETVDTSHIQEESFMSPDFSMLGENEGVVFVPKKLKAMKKHAEEKKKQCNEESFMSTDFSILDENVSTTDFSLTGKNLSMEIYEEKEVWPSNIKEKKKQQSNETNCMASEALEESNKDIDICKLLKKVSKHKEATDIVSQMEDSSMIRKNLTEEEIHVDSHIEDLTAKKRNEDTNLCDTLKKTKKVENEIDKVSCTEKEKEKQSNKESSVFTDCSLHEKILNSVEVSSLPEMYSRKKKHEETDKTSNRSEAKKLKGKKQKEEEKRKQFNEESFMSDINNCDILQKTKQHKEVTAKEKKEQAIKESCDLTDSSLARENLTEVSSPLKKFKNVKETNTHYVVEKRKNLENAIDVSHIEEEKQMQLNEESSVGGENLNKTNNASHRNEEKKQQSDGESTASTVDSILKENLTIVDINPRNISDVEEKKKKSNEERLILDDSSILRESTSNASSLHKEPSNEGNEESNSNCMAKKMKKVEETDHLSDIKGLANEKINEDVTNKVSHRKEISFGERNNNESQIGTCEMMKQTEETPYASQRAKENNEDSHTSTDYSILSENISVTDVTLLTKKKKREKKKTKHKESGDVSAQEDYSSDVYGVDVSFVDNTGNQKSTEEFLLKKQMKHEVKPSANDSVEVDVEESKKDTKTVKPTRKQSILADKTSEMTKNEPKEEDLHLTKDLIVKLNYLLITVPWSVPQLHTIETRVTGMPTSEQREKMRKLNVQIKSGIFSKIEDQQIRKNWNEFCRLHRLPPNPTPFTSFTSKKGVTLLPTYERIKFVRFLAHGLDNRPLFSVYKRFQRLFQSRRIKSGRFTKEEDETIKNYMQETTSQTPYSDLAKILNRDRGSVLRRCKLFKSPNSDTIKWDRKKIKEFVQRLLEVTESEDVAGLKDRKITTEEWRELAEKMKISSKKLQGAWFYTIYPHIFITCSVKTKLIKEEIVDLLIENEEDDWRNINWNKVAQEFEGFTSGKVNKMFKEMVNYHVPLEKQSDLEECLKYLQGIDLDLNLRDGLVLRKLKIDHSVSQVS